MNSVLQKVKKKRRTVELLEEELQSLYILLKIAPNRKQVEKMIKEREQILKRRKKNKQNNKEDKDNVRK